MFDRKGETLPWRAVVVVDNDAQLLNCDIAQLLSPSCQLDDVSWIKPGRVAWDWWNATNVIDVPEIVKYGAQKGVGVILWSSWRNLMKNTDAVMDHYAKMGVKGFKVDFFDRDDQVVNNSVWEISAKAAEKHLLMDYTPGAMVNATRASFFGNNDQPMSQGTRAHQVAMYTVFEAPLQMFADSPSNYLADAA